MLTAHFQHQLEQARQFLLSQKFTQALSRYERLAQRCPHEAVIWFEYGNAASGLRKRDLAERAWSKAIELAPRNAEPIGLIGRQKKRLGNFHAA